MLTKRIPFSQVAAVGACCCSSCCCCCCNSNSGGGETGISVRI